MPNRLRANVAFGFCALLLSQYTPGVGIEPVPQPSQELPGPGHVSPAPARDTRPNGGTLPPTAGALQVDVNPSGGSSNLNGVFDPGETVLIEPSWNNGNISFGIIFAATASEFIGPSGATYSILDSAAAYSLPPAGGAICYDCYVMSVDDPGARPAVHWDAGFFESNISYGGFWTWTLHVGGSFPDAPTNHLFYPYIENVFHNGITSGCGGGYCPANGVTRAQMAVFLLKSMLGAGYLPPVATGLIFGDVHVGDFAADWIEDLYGRGVTDGCGSGLYCPGDTVNRQQMAVYLLKAKFGASYTPPACATVFEDVACPSQFADWIEELYNEGVTGGCSTSPLLYCPTSLNSRGQIAVFLVKTFGMMIYKR